MKRGKFFGFVLPVMVMFFFAGLLIPATGEETGKKLFKVEYLTPAQKNAETQVAEKEKVVRYLQEEERRQGLQERVRLMQGGGDSRLGPSSVVITTNQSTVSSSSLGGNYVLMGTCTNTGSTSGVFIQVAVTLYGNSMSPLGTFVSYVRGGTNVNLGSGMFTNALQPGDTGFFYILTTLSPSQVAYYSSLQYNGSSYSFTVANASLAFPSNPVFSSVYGGYLNVNGYISNNSSNYLTYFTQVHFAIFNSLGQVRDVDYAYVDGASYQVSSVTTDTAIFPGTTQPFDHIFGTAPYSCYSSYLSAFEWSEIPYGGLPEAAPPFGSFDLPLDGSTVASSIPVTGWALDDSGVASVKIYTQQGTGLVYIGDAIMVEGARPDVAAGFPQYPNNTKAGWGYMMLTNFLPNGPDGTYVIEAIATDIYGKSESLGTNTIIVDNTHAVKPFGAIDNPDQGGTASGNKFVNNGWALTPQPNSLPSDGSTINVYVDGASLGHLNYGIYRSDIASFFPGYANANAASGYYYLDTTKYQNGVHTIQWTATDSAGNTDGIGSRFFSISNSNRVENEKTADSRMIRLDRGMLEQIPGNDEALRVKLCFNKEAMLEELQRDEQGVNRIKAQQMQYIEVNLNRTLGDSSLYQGMVVAGDELWPLPVGSTLDKEKGIFYWIPMAAFLGEYQLVFIESTGDGAMIKTDLIIEVGPKFIPELTPLLPRPIQPGSGS